MGAALGCEASAAGTAAGAVLIFAPDAAVDTVGAEDGGGFLSLEAGTLDPAEAFFFFFFMPVFFGAEAPSSFGC